MPLFRQKKNSHRPQSFQKNYPFFLNSTSIGSSRRNVEVSKLRCSSFANQIAQGKRLLKNHICVWFCPKGGSNKQKLLHQKATNRQQTLNSLRMWQNLITLCIVSLISRSSSAAHFADYFGGRSRNLCESLRRAQQVSTCVQTNLFSCRTGDYIGTTEERKIRTTLVVG